MSPLRRVLPALLALLLVALTAGIVSGRAADVGRGSRTPPRSTPNGNAAAAADEPLVCHYPSRHGRPDHPLPKPKKPKEPPSSGPTAVVLVTGHVSAEGWQPPPGVPCPPKP